jgi:hypothetical protein
MVRDPVEELRRWEDSGAHWQVVARTADRLTIALLRCDGGEEVERLVSDDPALRAFVGLRDRSED